MVSKLKKSITHVDDILDLDVFSFALYNFMSSVYFRSHKLFFRILVLGGGTSLYPHSVKSLCLPLTEQELKSGAVHTQNERRVYDTKVG